MNAQMTKRARNRLIIAMVVGILFGGCLLTLFFVPLPAANADILKVLVGFLGGAFTIMVSFYFGDSDGKDTGA